MEGMLIQIQNTSTNTTAIPLKVIHRLHLRLTIHLLQIQQRVEERQTREQQIATILHRVQIEGIQVAHHLDTEVEVAVAALVLQGVQVHQEGNFI